MQIGRRVPCNSYTREDRDNRSLVPLEPVHDLSKGVGAVEKCLTVGMFRGIQQAFLDAMGFKVSDNAL